MDKKHFIDQNNFISKSYLESLNQTAALAKETLESLAGSSALQSFIKDYSRVQELVQSTAESFKPAFKSLEAQQELMKTISNRDSYLIASPNLHILPIEKKKYTDKEVEYIVQRAIEKTISMIQKNDETLKGKNDNHKKFQPNLSWADIVIKFKDGHNVQIIAGEEIYTANYKEMGFEDSRKLKPNEQWIFLKLLSKSNGRVSWNDNLANTLIKKKKQLLADNLKKYFSINTDPFYPYKKEKAYQLKLNISPESESINKHLVKNKTADDLDDDLGIEESYQNFTNT